MAEPREASWQAAVRVERRAALIAFALVGALLLVTGVILVGYYRPSATPLHGDELHAAIVAGMVVRNLHRWGTHAMAMAVGLHAMFLVVSRLSARGVLRGGQPGWAAAASLGAVLVLILTAGWFVPWDALYDSAFSAAVEQARTHPQGGPFADLPGVDARYDARALLTAGRTVSSATVWRFWILHGIVLPASAAGLLALHFRSRKSESSRASKSG